jgi:alpha-amylase/alpha-mannosidase (GH57 family)
MRVDGTISFIFNSEGKYSASCARVDCTNHCIYTYLYLAKKDVRKEVKRCKQLHGDSRAEMWNTVHWVSGLIRIVVHV